ncbi:MAG: hypothetical protein JNL62_11815 [Bryobacterales bacterium]|nr:hypothetical protein [Bryobacterales bacterium]
MDYAYEVNLPNGLLLRVELAGRDADFEIVYPDGTGKVVFSRKKNPNKKVKGTAKPEGSGLTAEADVVRGGKKFKRVERSGDPATFVEYSDPDMP